MAFVDFGFVAEPPHPVREDTRGTPEQLKTLWDAGALTQTQIVAELRRSKQWVQDWKRRLGLVRPAEYWANIAPRANNRGDTFWTPEKIAQLKELCATTKMSATKIAAELGCKRNAVIGKCHRTGTQLPLPKTMGAPGGHKKKKRKPDTEKTPKPPGFRQEMPVYLPELVAFNEAIPEAQRVDILKLTNDTCRYPVGDPGTPEFFFCGGPAWRRAYCRTHYFYCHEEPRPRVRP